MDQKAIEKLIREKFPDQYKSGLDLTAQDVINMTPEIQRKKLKFLETGEIEDAEIEGYTTKSLTGMGMNQLAAFLMQDWLLREPIKAKEAIRRGRR
jgi:hypothetical protein